MGLYTKYVLQIQSFWGLYRQTASKGAKEKAEALYNEYIQQGGKRTLDSIKKGAF